MMMLYLPSGSPTAELFAASYNNTGKSKTITLEAGDYGYRENTERGWLKTTDNHGIYNTSSAFYIASPSNEMAMMMQDESLLYVTDCLNTLFIGLTSSSVRPLVCIPTSVFNSKYATDATLVDQ